MQIPNYIQNYIDIFLEPALGVIFTKYQVDISYQGGQWHIDATADDPAKLALSSHGQLIFDLQHVLRSLVKNYVKKEGITEKTHFILDINGYRQYRETYILNSITAIVEKTVLRAGKTIVLADLNGYERLKVHKILADTKGVDAESIGVRHNRKLLIRPTTEIGSSGIDNAIIITSANLIQFQQDREEQVEAVSQL